jgi:hypothetical protein
MVELTLFHHCNGGTNTVPPLGEGMLTWHQNHISQIFFRLAAPLQRCNMVSTQWWVIRTIVMLAAHPLIGMPLLDNCAEVSGKGNINNPRWQPK